MSVFPHVRGSARHGKWVLAFLLLFAGAGVMWTGCGKKGPPRPPARPLPPQVDDLAYSIRNDRIELSWTVARTDGRSAARAAAVKVFRSRLSAEDADCENCPVRYSVSGEISIQNNGSEAEPLKMRYTEFVEPGYRYIYKVIVYDEDGVGGKDSNLVSFDH